MPRSSSSEKQTRSRWNRPSIEKRLNPRRNEKREKKNRIIKEHLEYTVLNEVYEGTIYADIIDDVDGVRSRIMFMDAYTNYSVHKDQTPRYHLALITSIDLHIAGTMVPMQLIMHQYH